MFLCLTSHLIQQPILLHQLNCYFYHYCRNSNLDELNGKTQPVGLLDTGYITTTNLTPYDCAWTPYQYLLILTGTYSNVYDTKLVPSAIFNGTTSTGRLISYLSDGNIVEIHKNGSTRVNIKVNSATANLRVRIFGVL